jgi:hypothetical protein
LIIALRDPVMAGPDPAIHAVVAGFAKDVDARHTAGHDEDCVHE